MTRNNALRTATAAVNAADIIAPARLNFPPTPRVVPQPLPAPQPQPVLPEMINRPTAARQPPRQDRNLDRLDELMFELPPDPFVELDF